MAKTNLYLQLNGAGSGSITINQNDPEAVDFTHAKFIRILYRGAERGGFFVKNLEFVDASAEEAGGQNLEASGDGIPAILREGIVYNSTPGLPIRTFAASTIGNIMKTFFDEAKARGCFPQMIVDFDGTVDSDGAAWSDTHDIDFRVGQSLFDVISGLVELGVDYRVTFNPAANQYVLSIFDGGIGSDKTASVEFRIGLNAKAAVRRSETSELRNVFLTEAQASQYSEVSDAGSITEFGRREALYQAGQAPNTTQADIFASAELALKKDPFAAISITLSDATGPRVFIDYDIGDTANYIAKDGTKIPVRIVGINLSFDQAGTFADVTLDLTSVVLDQEILNALKLRRMAPGVSGSSFSSSPPPVTFHSELQGLDVDDHLQYLIRTGIRPMTGDLDMGENAIDNIFQMQMKIDIAPDPAHSEGLLFYDFVNKTLAVYNDISDVTLQVGQEQHMRALNNTGAQINDGGFVFINGASGINPTVELAKADSPLTADRIIGAGTHNIPNGTIGIFTTFGVVRGLDTSAFTGGDKIYLSASTAGEFTTTKPEYPNYVITLGSIIMSDVSAGQILVNVSGRIEDITDNGWNGSFLETISFTIASDGATITGSLEASGGGDLTLAFSDGFTVFDATPAATIALTAGTDANPQVNFIYIPKTTKVLTVSTSDWPTTEHVKVCTAVLRTAATTQTDGALQNRNWNDHVASVNKQGHMLHVSQRIRAENAKWSSGAQAVLTINTGPSPDDLFVSNNAGMVYQLHLQSFPALDMATGDDIHVVNDSVAPYKTITNLNSELTDAAGGALSNRYYNLVVWGVQNKTGEESHLMVNLPNGSYGSSASAIADISAFNVFDIPSIFAGTGFLMARYTVKHSPSGSGSWTLENTEDLRGKTPSNIAGGGGSVGATEFTGLTDTPSAYAGNAGDFPQVNAGETALEFSSTLTKDLDFAEFKAVAMVADNGATLPATPTKGQWFLHTPTGRDCLLMYDGANWIGIISLGSMTLFVDGASGTDDLDKGTGTGADAFATIQFAIDAIPGLVGGNVTINVSSGTYSESWTIVNKGQTGDFTITIQGVISAESSETASSGVQGVNNSTTYPQVTVSGAGWTVDEHQWKLVEFTSGTNDGLFRVVESNTTDTLTLAGRILSAAPTSGDTFDIMQWDTIFSGTNLVGTLQKGIEVNDIQFTHPTDDGIQIQGGANVSRCNLESKFGLNFFKNSFMDSTVRHCSFKQVVNAGIGVRAQSGSGVTIAECFFKLSGATGNTRAIVSTRVSFVINREGGVIDGYSKGGSASSGATLENNGGSFPFMRTRNCTTGMEATGAGFITGTTNMQYSGNTADESPSGASDPAFID